MSFNYAESLSALKALLGQVKVAGNDEGIKEMPATHDDKYDANQFEIKFKCQQVIRNLIADTKGLIATYSQQRESHEAALRNGVALPDIGNIRAESERNIRALVAQEGPTYIQRKVDYWIAEKNRDAFMIEKGITINRSSAPESQKAHYMIIVAYSILETIVNWFIFNEALSGPDAVTVSAGITLLNILPAVVVGNYLRNFNSENLSARYLSVALAVIWFFFITWLNLGVSVLRSFLNSASVQGAAPDFNLFNNEAINKIFFSDAFLIFKLQAPPINDFIAILLFLIGILFACIACWKGYTSDEKIPELGGLNRDFEESKENFLANEKKLREYLTEINQNNSQIFKTVQDKFNQAKRDYLSSTQMIRDKTIEFERHYQGINDEYIYLINIYRDANRASRKSPPPSYFLQEKEPVLSDVELPDFSKFSQEKIREDVAQIENIYKEKTDELNLLWNQFNDHLEELNNLFETKIQELDLAASKAMIKPI